MIPKYENALFDLDGTLTDPGKGITNSVAYSLAALGEKVPPREELYKFIGPPLLYSYRKYCGFSEEKSREAVRLYREYFTDRGIFENILYPGTVPMLDALSQAGVKIFLATSKPENFAVRILDKFGLSRYFDGVYGADMDGARSEKADVIAYAMRNEGITRAIMTGDRENDILGAKANGIDSIGVLYGYGDRAELVGAGADFIVKTQKEAGDIILWGKY